MSTNQDQKFEQLLSRNFPRRGILFLASLSIFSDITGILIQMAVIFINDTCASTAGSSKIGLALTVLSLMSGITGLLLFSKPSRCCTSFYLIFNFLSYMISLALIGLAMVGIDDLRGPNFWFCTSGDIQSKFYI